jgi:hypothetical protein
MSGGDDLNVEPGQLVEIGRRWYRLVPELEGKPPAGATGPYPSAMGAEAVTGAAGTATGALQEKLGANGANATASGQKYGQAESSNSSGLKDFVSMTKEVTTTFTGALQAVSSAAGALSSAGASGLSAAASSASSLVGSLGKIGGGQTPVVPPVAPVATPLEHQDTAQESHHDEQQPPQQEDHRVRHH